jgi:hypothetical protein
MRATRAAALSTWTFGFLRRRPMLISNSDRNRAWLLARTIALLLCLQTVSSFASNAPLESKTDTVPCSEFSSVLLSPQNIRYTESSPTRIRLMPARWTSLQITLAGYERTGVPLVGWDGNQLVAATAADDSGLDYFVPRLAALFRIPLARSVDLFLGGVLVSCYTLGLIGILLLLKNPLGRCLAILELLVLALLCYKIGDVYLVQPSVAVAFIPWALYFLTKSRAGVRFALFLAAVGVALGAANFLRAQAGTAVLLFCLVLVPFYGQYARKWRALSVACLCFGYFASALFFRHQLAARDSFLREHEMEYVPASTQHPFWHSVYIGLGFISNPYVPGGYCDKVAVDKVRSVSPNAAFLSPEYDRILAREVVELAKRHPALLVINVAAKIGIVQVLLLLAGNLGWLAALIYRKPLSLEVAFWTAIAFGVLPGLLVVPSLKYVLGGVAVLVLYALLSIDSALQLGAVRDFKRMVALRGKTVCAA